MSTFPTTRLRRLRQSQNIRALVRENHLSVDDLIAPLFVIPGQGMKKPISSLDGQHQLSVDEAVKEAQALYTLGIKAILLFGIPDHKDAIGSSSYDPNGVVQKATTAIKQAIPDMVIMADLCFCEYTDHGHCGVIEHDDVDNDATLVETAKQTLSLAKAGVDVIAPSGMMDGVVGTIRSTLDEAGYKDTLVMGYSAKYASAYYGPFREAVESTPSFGDRRTYQMDPANGLEALREVELDIDEGADIVMVKPALAYLDVMREIKNQFPLPLACYNVSGEYAMIKHAAKAGLVDEEAIVHETLLSMKRAGADLIITYFAKQIAFASS